MTLHALWLGHPDARKVFDCSIETNPEGRYSIAGSATLMRGKSSTVELRTNPEGRYSIAGSATLMRGKSSPGRRSPACNQLQLRRREARWRAAGGELPVRRITNSIRPGADDEPARERRSPEPQQGRPVALRGSVIKRRREGVRCLETEW